MHVFHHNCAGVVIVKTSTYTKTHFTIAGVFLTGYNRVLVKTKHKTRQEMNHKKITVKKKWRLIYPHLSYGLDSSRW